MNYKDGIYFEVFAVKDGVRYNSKVISLNDVSKVMTNSLMDGLQEIVMGDRKRGHGMNYMEFYSESCHKSRKERTCECCGKKIHIGDYYSNQRGKWEGEFFQRDLCLTCEKAISVFCSEIDNEFDYDEIHEDAQVRVCYECDKHYDDTCEEECTMWCPKVKQYYEERG